MKKVVLLFAIMFGFCVSAQITTTPSPPEANQAVTLFFNKAGTGLATYNGTIYAHMGVTVNNATWQNVKGSWGNNTTQPALTLVSGTTYSLTITPDLYTYFGVSNSAALTQICVVFRSDTGGQQTTDYFVNIGAFQATLTAPALNSTTIVNSGGSLAITANNTNGNASYNLLANGTSIYTSNGATFSYTDSNITTNKNYDLQITQGVTTFSRQFAVVVNPGTVSQAMPTAMEDGITYSDVDNTKAWLVLTAPGKDFVYVAGNFNNWQPDTSYAMKRDPSTQKFWIELNGLTPNAYNYYQYWVVDTTPTTNSPALVKTADPYSTLVVNPYDDPYIPAANYPNMPVMPAGQSRDVTVLQTGQTPYNWQVTNFTKPKKDDLIVYEVLVRDFDADRSYQNLIDRIEYFKNLKINAIQLMPVMEFEGNESWGYNTSFHMALDKFYGSATKFKEFIDLCHQNGIAVILDVALNHAFGRNPMVRMWMKDPDGDGWGDPAADNPYFNEFAKHSYSVGSDFNHSSALTKTYVKRVIKQWIEEFHIDGFRWDLTKGFTQNCSGGDDTCTNAYQADRVAVLKEYADYSWQLDPTHFAIFEHLGTDNEEQQWANYRLNETPSKGVMMWGEMTYQYSQLMKGYSQDGDISRMGNVSRGFTAKRLIGYPESHDKDRMVYGAMTFGNSNGVSPLNNLNNSLTRMSTLGAVSLLVPGPKMIWHFAELGYDDSIYTCTNGTVNTESDPTAGDCKLSTKPQEQWTNNWLGVPARLAVYNNWSKMINMKINEPVFEGDYAISPDGNNIRQRIYVYNNALPANQLKNVVIIANFSVAAQNINPSFPYAGTWYNLMDNTSMNVTNTTATISVPAGEFRIYGNQLATLGQEEFDTMENVMLYPNPSSGSFQINTDADGVEVFSITGQRVKSFPRTAMGDTYQIGDLPNGVYLVKISQGSRQKTVRLVRQ
ncbi:MULTISPECIES: alpha-amylase family glycosyl hydrolase [unclassified Flavobacterium]|uniref:alpha-amylase family glycosyl hydrolase n=1 Tax=unclassified Flavobacterium TaxID=196869 RepID=UPI001F13D8A8|nr:MULTISPECIES: alpha-amylase family glycosyl hydrolase [unclassified Flavobacterium]UMY65952.1 alpha-amylase family glycosyl hydrolase [Flavobacterium sp. HJ-32-4]